MAANNNPVARWCVTVNNWTEDDVTSASNFFETDVVKYAVMGKEVGEQGTPHLQIFFILTTTQRFSWVQTKFPRGHIEKAHHSSQQNSDYCKKEGDFDEWGDLPSDQGKRNDLLDAIKWAETIAEERGRPPTSPEVAAEFPVIYCRYPRFTRTITRRAQAVLFEEGNGEPVGWQRDLEGILDGEADDRSVYFYIDYDGRKGKSWFQRYYYTKHVGDVQLLSSGKREDVAHTIDISRRVFFFNIPRDSIQYLQYTILEQLKDRVIFSPKYESQTKMINHKVHVVVFTNEMPDNTKMSRDRFKLVEI